MPKKIKRIILRTFSIVLVCAVLVLFAAFAFARFYVIPRYNAKLGEGAAEEDLLTTKEVFGIAKNLVNLQTMENLASGEISGGKELVKIAEEIEAELAEGENAEELKKPEKSDWSEAVTFGSAELARPTPAPKQTPLPTPVNEKNTKTSNTSDVPTKSEAKGSTARERILNAATKEEISAGTAILAKVDMGKVNSLRSQGKTSELKKYITSVLTSAEIRTALSLYSKYKHLL